eukprot:superscaffoldBa00004098_g18270
MWRRCCGLGAGAEHHAAPRDDVGSSCGGAPGAAVHSSMLERNELCDRSSRHLESNDTRLDKAEEVHEWFDDGQFLYIWPHLAARHSGSNSWRPGARSAISAEPGVLIITHILFPRSVQEEGPIYARV